MRTVCSEIKMTKVLQTNVGRSRAAHDLADIVAAKTKMRTMKVLQINLNRRPRSHDLMEAKSLELGVDIIIASEPNMNLIRNDESWMKDKLLNTGIKIRNRELSLGVTESREGVVMAEINKIKFYSVYIPRNDPMENTERILGEINDVLGQRPKRSLIAGDLNGKSAEWGEKRTDRRGCIVAEWIASKNLTVYNEREKPTVIRWNGSSIADITVGTEDLKDQVRKWAVLDDETLSDHMFLYYEVAQQAVSAAGKEPTANRWNLQKMNPDKTRNAIKRKLDQTDEKTPGACMQAITEACNETIPKKRGGRTRRQTYWWNNDIAEKRKASTRARRVLMRARKHNGAQPALQEDYRGKNKSLQLAIKDSKEKKWKELMEEVDRDVWGDGYRIVCKRLRKPATKINEEIRAEVINDK